MFKWWTCWTIVPELQHKATKLQKLAEEKGNSEALALVQHAIDLIRQAKQMASEENYEGAKQLLMEAYGLLNKAEMMLHGGPYTNVPSDINYADKFTKFVSDLEHKANKLQKVAEDQDNKEALALIQQAKDLITKARQMISEESYEEAKLLLRDANDLLNKAEVMLHGGSYTTVSGKEETPYYPPHPPANDNRPDMHQVFSLVGVGTATEGEGNTADVFAELELSVFKATRNMMLLRITDGIITVDDAIYTVEKGKAIMAMRAHKMILTAKVSSDDTAETVTLKLFGSMPNIQPDSSDNPTTSMPTIMLRGKLAQMHINLDAEVA